MRRRALAFTLASWTLWSIFAVVHARAHAWADLDAGRFTDHFSHMNAARLFPRLGPEFWRKPAAELLPPLTAEEIAGLPDDVRQGGSYTGGLFRVDGWPAGKPVAM